MAQVIARPSSSRSRMVALVVVGPFLPAWLRFVGTVALANALVVLGLLLLMRTGSSRSGRACTTASAAMQPASAARTSGLRTLLSCSRSASSPPP